MCGISGWILPDEELARAQKDAVETYLSCSLGAMEHRGPDSGGRVLLTHGAIGARRLAIIDVEGGDQPLANEDGSVVAVLNGEIYNFRGLRRELEAAGHRFRTRCDTEVLAHGYEEWGLDLPAKLQGMYAFAVWDSARRRLLLCRDRLGKKPLFYTTLAGGLRFASELKALLADGKLRPRLDVTALMLLLELQHLPPPFTPLEGIEQLSPGTWLVARPSGEGSAEKIDVAKGRYWDLVQSSTATPIGTTVSSSSRAASGAFGASGALEVSEAFRASGATAGTPHTAAARTSARSAVGGAVSTSRRTPGSTTSHLPAEFLARLSEVAARRTVADVPIGIFLSGGIDSSLVAAALVRAGHELHAYSVGFSDLRYDELDRARRVAQHLGLEHTYEIVGPPTPEDLSRLVWHLDEPLADSSAIPAFQVAAAASKHVKVVLSGDGGDEFFGGYPKHHLFSKIHPALSLAKRTPLRPALERAATLLLSGSLGSAKSRANGWGRHSRELFRRSRPFRRHGTLPEFLRTPTRQAAKALGLAALDEPSAYLDFLGAVPCFARPLALGEWVHDHPHRPPLDAPPSELLGSRDPWLGERLSLSTANSASAWPLMARLALYDALTELPGDILVKVDRTSMASSLEVRCPFLDHELVAWALSLPDSWRRRRGETKPLLRDAARMVLPPEIAAAPKRGFGVPLSDWMRGDLGVLATELLLDRRTIERGLIDPSYTAALIEANTSGADLGPRLWQLVVLELWARSFLDRVPPEPVTL